MAYEGWWSGLSKEERERRFAEWEKALTPGAINTGPVDDGPHRGEDWMAPLWFRRQDE